MNIAPGYQDTPCLIPHIFHCTYWAIRRADGAWQLSVEELERRMAFREARRFSSADLHHQFSSVSLEEILVRT
ncbi:hypothetical protein EJB05_25675, partial [Eragrostis curvula]